MKVLFLAIVAALAASSAVTASSGCSQQSEGERCSCANGNDDCGDGLECVAGPQLGGQTEICCPAEGSRKEALCLAAEPNCVHPPSTTTTTTTTTTTMTGAGGTSGGGGSGGSGGAGGTSGGGGN